MDQHHVKNKMLEAIDRAEAAIAQPHFKREVKDTPAELEHTFVVEELKRLRDLVDSYDWETNKHVPGTPGR